MLHSPSTPVGNLNQGLAQAVALTKCTHRQDALLAGVRAIAGHSSLTGSSLQVPQGKSVIVLTPPGNKPTTLTRLFMRHPHDINRLVVGHLRPAGHHLYVKRFDAGRVMPEMWLERYRSGPGGSARYETGVFPLPFKT